MLDGAVVVQESRVEDSREFVVEAYLLNVSSRVIADVSGLEEEYIYGVIHREGLREVRDMIQRERLVEWMEARGLQEGFAARERARARGRLSDDLKRRLAHARRAAAAFRESGGS